MSRLQEDSRKIQSNYDKLQLRYDDEVYNGGAWKKEKEHLDTKIKDLTKQGTRNGDYGTRRPTITDRDSALSTPRAPSRVERC